MIFGISLLVLHIATPIIYGLCAKNTFQIINITSVVTAIFLAILCVAGTNTFIQVSDSSSATSSVSPGPPWDLLF